MTPTFIMAVPFIPERARNAVEIAWSVGATVVWDEQQSIVDTFQRTLAAAGDEPAIILQDDVILAAKWRERVEAVIAERPNTVIQFFSIRQSDLQHGARMQPGSKFLMNQCFYLPEGAAADLLAFSREWFSAYPNSTADDLCVRAWLTATGSRYWHHVPSLVQHRSWSSTLGSRSTARTSPTFEENQ